MRSEEAPGTLGISAHGLSFAGETVSTNQVLGFHESLDPWSDRVRLTVVGPGWTHWADDPGYGQTRRALRSALPHHPFTADWSHDGWFAGRSRWLPTAWRVPLTAVAWAAVVVTVAVGTSSAVAWAVAAVGGLLTLQRAEGVQVAARGLRVGPPWAAWRPWHRVVEVRTRPVGPAIEVRVLGPDGVSRALVSRALLPALRGRTRRLGALVPQACAPDLDEQYLGWVPWAVGAPWGVLAATAVVAPWVSDRPALVGLGVWAALSVGAVGAAIESRVRGWGFGALLWMCVAYGAGLGTLLWLATVGVGLR